MGGSERAVRSRGVAARSAHRVRSQQANALCLERLRVTKARVDSRQVDTGGGDEGRLVREAVVLLRGGLEAGLAGRGGRAGEHSGVRPLSRRPVHALSLHPPLHNVLTCNVLSM